MARRTFVILGLAVAFLAVARAADVDDAGDDEYEDVTRAHLVIRKSIKGGEGSDLQVAGRNVTIVIDIHNAGTA